MSAAATRLSAIADRFFTALEGNDVAAVVSCYAPDATLWHNFDQVKMTPAENAASLRDYFARFPARTYQDVRRGYLADDGVVQQHVLRLVRLDGRTFDWPGCIVLRVRNDKIQLLEEYVDLASFLQRMS
jgi:ketosteroid isomerase-like protein